MVLYPLQKALMHIYLICFTQRPHEAGRISTPILQMTHMWLGWDMLEDNPTKMWQGQVSALFPVPRL